MSSINKQHHKINIIIASLATPGTNSNVADIASNPCVRFILYCDKQTNGVQSQAEQLMEDPATATTHTVFCSFQNKANFGRFQVLRDKKVRLGLVTSGVDGANTTSQTSCEIPFNITVRFRKPLIVRFNGTSSPGTVGDIVDNSLHLICTKSDATFSTNFSYVCRTYYKDV